MRRLPAILLILVLLASCSRQLPLHTAAAPTEQSGLPCAYSYFLRGSQAEYTQHYPEALAAYEQALRCDPKANYIEEKIPILMLKMGDMNRATDWLQTAIVNHPENITYKLFLANLYVQQQQIPKAIALYDHILARDPDNEAVHIRLALLYSRENNYAKAEAILRQRINSDDQSYFAHLSLARLLKQREAFSEAAVEYEKVLALNWSDELAHELGFLYVYIDRITDALRIYTTITENNPLDVEAALSRAQALFDLGRQDEAMEVLVKTRRFSDDPESIDIIISKVLIRQNKLEAARKILLKLAQNENSSEPRFMLALLAFQQGDDDTSLKYLATIGASDAEFEEAVYLMVRIYTGHNQSQRALDLLRGYVMDEDSSSPLFFAVLSSMLQERGNLEEAREHMQRATELYPENHQLLFEYGLLLENSGMHEAAQKRMERVLILQPDHAEALNFIGYTWADRNIRLDEALIYIERAHKLKPDNGFIVDSLGWVYFRQGKYDKAAETLEKSLVLEPADPHIYDHLGDAYRAMEEYDKALEAYKKAYEMFDDKSKRQGVKEKIEKLEK